MRIQIFLMILGALALTSCSNFHSLDSAVITSPMGDLSQAEVVSVIISDDRDQPEKLIVTKIDGENVNRYKLRNGVYRFPPGFRKIRVKYSKRGFPSHRLGYATIEVNLEAGRRYIPYGKAEGSKLNLWFADATTKEVVSEYQTVDTYLSKSNVIADD